MGMTDKQFAAYIRQLIKRLKGMEELLNEGSNEKAKSEMQEMLDDLQKSIED